MSLASECTVSLWLELANALSLSLLAGLSLDCAPIIRCELLASVDTANCWLPYDEIDCGYLVSPDRCASMRTIGLCACHSMRTIGLCAVPATRCESPAP